jgi:hypothetical protein
MSRMLAIAVVCPFVVSVAAAGEAMTLWYRRPARKWVEALPLGNGRLGAMVFGSAPRERLQLNEESLWAGEPFDVYPHNFAKHLADKDALVVEGADEVVLLFTGAIDLKPNERRAKNTMYLIFPWRGDAAGRAKAKEHIAGWARPMQVIWSDDHWTVIGDGMDALKDPKVTAMTRVVISVLRRARLAGPPPSAAKPQPGPDRPISLYKAGKLQDARKALMSRVRHRVKLSLVLPTGEYPSTMGSTRIPKRQRTVSKEHPH